MTKKNQIRTYEDLQLRKAQLKELLAAQKELLHLDIQEIKEELKPVRNAISFAGRLTRKDSSNPLLTSGTDLAIDLIVRKGLLSRAGWLSRLVVPFFLKNYTSHVIDDKKEEIGFSIRKWISNLFSKNEKDTAEEKEDENPSPNPNNVTTY